MSNHTEQLDLALEQLAEGASLADVQRAYPELATELASYGKMLGMLSEVSKEKPSEAHFERLLSAPAAEQVASPFSFVSFFSVYREALVFPVLALLIVASAAFLPGRQPGEELAPMEGTPELMNTSLEGGDAGAATEAAPDARMMQFSAPAGTGPADVMLMKTVAPTMAPEAPTTTEDMASSTPETVEESTAPEGN